MTDLRHRRAGGTLVEVMISCMLLAIIAIGSGSYLSLARAQVLHGRSERVALDVLDRRLERIRAADYDTIKPPFASYTPVFLTRSGTNWVHSATDPGEEADLNGQMLPMKTRVRYIDVDGGAASYDAVHVEVRADTRANGAASVRLETVVGP